MPGYSLVFILWMLDAEVQFATNAPTSTQLDGRRDADKREGEDDRRCERSGNQNG
jgi:hypothetical protein